MDMNEGRGPQNLSTMLHPKTSFLEVNPGKLDVDA